MSFLKSIGNIFKSVGKVVGSLGNIAKVFSGILSSPIGNLLKMAFPPLALAQGALSFVGMAGDLASSIGGGKNY